MDYNKILDEVAYPPEYNREKAIEAIKKALSTSYFPANGLTPPPAPKDLRDRAKSIANQVLQISKSDRSILAALIEQLAEDYASEVSAEKDREIQYWKDQAIEANNQLVDAGEHVIELKQRIAELEAEIQNIHWDNIEAENKRDIS